MRQTDKLDSFTFHTFAVSLVAMIYNEAAINVTIFTRVTGKEAAGSRIQPGNMFN
jgi:hypothetical protein